MIGLLGGSFLIGLGAYYLFFKKYHSKEEMDAGIKIAGTTHAKLFITGFLINTLNPGDRPLVCSRYQIALQCRK